MFSSCLVKIWYNVSGFLDSGAVGLFGRPRTGTSFPVKNKLEVDIIFTKTYIN